MKIQILESRQLLSAVIDEIETIGQDIETIAHDGKLVIEGLEELHKLGIPQDVVEIFIKISHQAIQDVENGNAKNFLESFTKLIKSESEALHGNSSVTAALLTLLKNQSALEDTLKPLAPYLEIVMSTLHSSHIAPHTEL